MTPLGFTNSEGVFLGWALSESGNPEFDDQEFVVNLTTEANQVVNLYAIWREETCYLVTEDEDPIMTENTQSDDNITLG